MKTKILLMVHSKSFTLLVPVGNFEIYTNVLLNEQIMAEIKNSYAWLHGY